MKNVNDIHKKLGLANSTKGSETDKYRTCKKRCSKLKRSISTTKAALVRIFDNYFFGIDGCFSDEFKKLYISSLISILDFL